MGDIAPEKKEYPEKEVASVAVFNPEGKLLFGQRADTGKWTLPGGHLDADERPEAGAVRELREEVGLTPESESLKLLGNDVITSWKGTRIRVHAFRCNIPPGQEVSYENDPDGEMQDHEWVDPEFIPSHILENLHSPKNVTLRLLGLQDWAEVEEGPDEAPGERLADFQAPHLQMQNQPVAHPATTFKSELEKGVAARQWPFQPRTDMTPDAMDEIRRWQANANVVERENVSQTGMPATGISRALHKLHAHTQVRVDPATGNREFLLHRGMGQDEYEGTVGPWGHVGSVPGEQFVKGKLASSWTPHYDQAERFSGQYEDGGPTKKLPVVSAWIPETRITAVPNQVDGGGEFAPEHEVIVGPHYSKLATPEEIRIPNPGNLNINERINQAGRMAERPTHQDERLRARVTANRLRTAHASKLPPKGPKGRQPPETDDPLERAERSHAPLELDHYSPMRGLKRIDPSFQGTGAFGLHGGEAQRTSRIPRTYYYHAGTEPESTFKSGSMQRYRVKLPKGAKLYDIGKDSHNLFRPKVRHTDDGVIHEPMDLDEIEKKIRKLGFYGYKNYHPSIPNAVAVFYPLDAKPMSKSVSEPLELAKTDVEVLMQHPNRAERMMALKLPGVTAADVRRGVEDPDAQVALAALKHPLVDANAITQALAHAAPNVRMAAVRHPLADGSHLEQALIDTNPMVRRALATHHKLDHGQLAQLISSGDPEVLDACASNPNLSPEQAVAILINPGVKAETKALIAAAPHIPSSLKKAINEQLGADLQRSASRWLELRKGHPTPTFPKLGLPDNPRETPIVETDKELHTKHVAIRQQSKNAYGPEMAAHDYRTAVRHPGAGMTYTGPGAGTGKVNVSYSRSTAQRGVKFDPEDVNTFASSNAAAGGATKLHEDLHQMFNRVMAKYGVRGRKVFAHNLYHSMPTDVKHHVDDYATLRDPSTRVTSRMGELTSVHPYPYEERMAVMLNYLNNPGERSAYHTYLKHSPEVTRAIGTAIKRAHSHLLAAAQVAPESWAQSIQPWAQKLGKAEDGTGDGYQSVSAEAAHQTGNAVRGKDEDLIPLADPDFVHDFEGHHLDESQFFEAARFLSGKRERASKEVVRAMVWEEDGDTEAAALRAYGMVADPAHRKALQGVLAVVATDAAQREPKRPDHYAIHNAAERLGKAEPGPGGNAGTERAEDIQAFEGQDRPKTPGSIRGATPSAEPVAQAIIDAFKDEKVEAVALKGKHSKGTLIAHDPHTDDVWLLKPGSGPPSPAAGIAETVGTQSAREACFYACAKHVFALGESCPKCELLLVDGQQIAAMQFLPPEFRSLEKRAKDDSMRVLWSLHAYLKMGLLHKWAVMDWVLGNVDRHGQNILANNAQPERMYLIDHGSTFAGLDFDPAHDHSSFVPYYLRAWSPRKFNTLPPQEKQRRMPVADHHVEVLLRDWLSGLSGDALRDTIARYGLDPAACLKRLAHVKTLLSDPKVKDISVAIDGLWVGAD